MSKPLPFNLEAARCLRNEKGLSVFEASRQVKIDAIREEVAKPQPDFAAVILTLLELI
jgi:hypothetical protein